MAEWILSSSVLTAAILLLRQLFDGKVSRRLQYGLWLLVLVRLLIPGSIAQSAMSVADLLSRQVPVQQLTAQLTAPSQSYESALDEVLTAHSVPAQDFAQLPQPQQEQFHREAEEKLTQATPAYTLKQILTAVWLAGMSITAAWILLSNLLFLSRLRASRKKLDAAAPIGVYVSGAVQTPCLFGLLRPSVYLTGEAVESPNLPLILRHELTHHRHGDHIWAAARCLCLVLHWYNPLVWLAAQASRQDAELACDEGVLQNLSQEERTQYGQALIQMSCVGTQPFVLTATTMTGDKKSLYRRVQSIAKKPRLLLSVAALLVAAVLIAAGCTFTGIRDNSEETPPVQPTVPVETTQPTTPPETTQPATFDKKDADEMLALLKVKLATLMYIAETGDDTMLPWPPFGYVNIGTSYETDQQLPTGNGHSYLLPHGTPLYASPEDPEYVYYQTQDGYRRLTLASLLYDVGGKPGTTHKIAFFNTLLRPAYQNIYHQAAGQDFTDPVDVDLSLLFYSGFPEWEQGVKPLTAAEEEFLRSKGWGDEMPLSNAKRFPIQAMDEYLRKYLGIGFEDTNKVGLEDMDYFPETQCYYTWRSDARSMELNVVEVRGTVTPTSSNRIYVIHYEIADVGTFCMGLQYSGNAYCILCNYPIAEGNPLDILN